MIKLRPYQHLLVDAIREAMRRHRRVLGVAPTGAGKTVIFAYIVSAVAERRKRVLIVAHRREITQQISDALDRMNVPHGRIEAGFPRTNHPVQVGMVITVANAITRGKITEPDLLVIDEAHHAVATSYQTMANDWQRVRVLGVTATPERLDGKGLDVAFESMVLGPTVRSLIDQGYLAPFVYFCPPQVADFHNVGTSAGDYNVSDLAKAMNKATITGDAIEHYRRHLGGQSAICFCVDIEHATSVAAMFRDAGFAAEAVDGTMSIEVRADRIKAIGDGRLQILTSCQIISEGTDIPSVNGAILLRPTKSRSMFLQQVGRTLRPKPDGTPAIILDHVGNVHGFGLPDSPQRWSLKGRQKSDASTTTCSICLRVFDTHPEWRLSVSCLHTGLDGMEPPGCLLLPEATLEEEEEGDGEAEREPPEMVAGELEVFNPEPAWAGGLNLSTARGTNLYRILELASCEAHFRQIAMARNYREGWIKRSMRELLEKQRQGNIKV